MKNMIILFLFMSMMFILATTHSEARNIAQREHLDKCFTEYTNRYFFPPDNNVDHNSNIKIVKNKNFSTSILKDMGLL